MRYINLHLHYITLQQHNNEEHFKTNKSPNEITVCLQTFWSHTKVAGMEVFLSEKRERSRREQVV